MNYTVYRREFQVRYNGFGYFMGDVLVILLHTRSKFVAIAWAFLSKSKWCEGILRTKMPTARKIAVPWKLRWISWKIRRALRHP